jgi:hypothetical protein
VTRVARRGLAAAFALALAVPALAAPPAPSVAGIRYANPSAYLDLPASLGDVQRVRSIAAQLKQPTAEATLASIGRWVRRNLKPHPKPVTEWRPVEAIVRSATYGACGEHAVVFGALARACGIPAVWVKAADVEWILAFRRGGPAALRTPRGHVFLEVHVDGKWALLDTEAGLLHARYDPAWRILPGNRFAYDKGGDPFALLLTCRFAEWKQQADAYFGALDLSQVPWSQPRDLMSRWNVHVAGADPQAAWATAVAKAYGLVVPATIAPDDASGLARARGATLVVLASGGRPVLHPSGAAHLPRDAAGFLSRSADGKDWLDVRHPDGTRVILVRAEDEAGVTKALSEAFR